jgi:hypothetical protein
MFGNCDICRWFGEMVTGGYWRKDGGYGYKISESSRSVLTYGDSSFFVMQFAFRYHPMFWQVRYVYGFDEGVG